ncbi:hypothetical protein P3G55_08725 [Leptospira sp. 96542]|nr:hypothetical protein [Leptospira sp. 96542]
MALRSFTSSSKLIKYVSILLLSLVTIFGLDHILFENLFPQYDKMYEVKKNFVPAEVLVIGSSHALWDIDPTVLQTKTGKPTTMVSIPGANLELRRQILEEYVRKYPTLKYLVLETDKYAFDELRYSKDAYLQLLGYYHKNLFQTMLKEKRGNNFDFKVMLVFKTHSLNSYSHFILSKLYDKYLPKFVKVLAKEPVPKPANGDERVAEWRKEYNGNVPQMDSGLVSELHNTLTFAKEKGIQVILLETPTYYFSESENAPFDVIRSKIKTMGNEAGAKFIRFPEFEKTSELFFDASHLLPSSRQSFTERLAKEI